jgi:branched-chain amino acid transport system permease protein
MEACLSLVTHKESQSGLRTLWIWIAGLAIVWVLQQFLPSWVNPYYFRIVMFAGINIILAVSLNLLNGFTGQFSMGHAGFMSVGGYVSAFITLSLRSRNPILFNDPSVMYPVFIGALMVGGLVASAVGYLVGLPTLRLRGDYLAIVTLGSGEIIRVILLNIEAVGGAAGLPGIPTLTNFGFVYTGVIVTVFVVWRLVHSSYGRAFLAVREDEIAAEAMGVNTTRVKVRAFVIGAFFAGVAGGLFAHYLSYLNPAMFNFSKSFEIIIMVVMGGMGSISGAVISAILLTILPEALRPLQQFTGVDFRMVIYSLVLIILMLTRPNGLFGTREYTDFLPISWRKKILGKET